MAATKKRKKKSDVKPVDQKFNFSKFIHHFVITCQVIIVIIYFAIHAVARTDGFRSIVSEKLEDITGLTAIVESSKLDLFLNLKIHRIICEDKDIPGEPYLHAEEVFINWKPFSGFGKKAIGKIEIKGLKLKAVRDEGIWYPFICAPLKDKAQWLKSGSLENIIIDFFAKRAADNELLLDESLYFSRLHFPVRIYNADITWMKNPQVVEGSLKKCVLSAEEIDSNDRKMEHFVMACEQFLTPQTGPLNHVEFEWMHTKDNLVFIQNGVTTKSHVFERPEAQVKTEPQPRQISNDTPREEKAPEAPETPVSDLEQQIIDSLKGALEN